MTRRRRSVTEAYMRHRLGSAGCVARPDDNVDSEAGLYAGTDTRHVFYVSTPPDMETFCWWCFGGRDDPRHWLPTRHQEAEDELVAEYEDARF